MTALAGCWNLGGATAPADACARMLQAQQAYGPEGPLTRSDGPITLGRRLFRTLPEDAFDRGPMAGRDGRDLLIADIRIDNRAELAAALAIDPGELRQLADAAILMRALERWGEGAVDHLAGDFAFAWWDRQQERLVLARDFLGQKPLHYHRGNGFFAFASMPKGLHALPEIPRAPDRRATAMFLALLPEDGPESFFEGISKVPAGHVVTVTASGLTSRRYWDPHPDPLRLKNREDYEEALRERLDEAVAAQLRGCGGRVASHLSGGLDSSAIAATAARLLAPSGGTVTAFTAVPPEGFAGPAPRETFSDEGPLAAEVARLHPNIEHVLVRSKSQSPLAGLADDYFYYERPILNLCNWTWINDILAETRSRGLPILLSGASGNMSFSYDGMGLLTQLLRSGRLLRLAREAALLRRGGTRAGTIAAQAIGPFLPIKLWRFVNRLRGADRSLTAYSAIDPALARTIGLEALAKERGLDLDYRPRADPVEARIWSLRRIDQGNYKKGILARWGVDMRDPAADRRLVEFCLAVPAEQFLADGRTRSLARRALADRLPASLLNERRKGYQGVDWHVALDKARAGMTEEVEAISDCPEAAEAIDTNMLSRLIADWPKGTEWDGRQALYNYRLALLRGVSAGRFIRQALGRNR
ncbi:MAG TPA: asparagine synthase-related protein [Allosphingosinicella sp.]|nr:asparagine synthase-related protein [Allosphingosinicella sp.]